MRNNILVFLLFVRVAVAGFSQETDAQETDSRKTNLYTFFANIIVKERRQMPLIGGRFPLIGLVNIAKGDYADAHLGLVNGNTGHFTGLQLGFFNTAGGNVNGMRAGFANIARGDENGLQAGFLNIVGGDRNGLHVGFVNVVGGHENGLHAGFVNITGGSVNGIHAGLVNIIGGGVNGIHLGFVNAISESANGIQAGFVNAVDGTANGIQLGFVNVAAKGMSGLQTGFFNYADHVEKGIPVGVISIVRSGGYQAAEYGFSEWYPVQIAVKLGVEKFYTSIIGACDSGGENLASGVGIGKVMKTGNAFFFNPEINVLSTLVADGHMFLSLLPLFGCTVTRHFSIMLGPSVTWTHRYGGAVLKEPVFSIYEYNIDSGNRITAGAKAGARFRL
ncbi:MAG: hypothetical protein LBK61_11960 [Spirochaetaceae bacterium]|nr:hypothetical protein [Spirochaetaceae bacterium]